MVSGHKPVSDISDINDQGFGTADNGWAGDWAGLSSPLDAASWRPTTIGIPAGPHHTSANSIVPVSASQTVQTVLYSPDVSKVVHSQTATTTTGSGTTTSGSGTSSSSSFVINVSWDASVQSAPSGFTTGVLAAVQWLESQIDNPVTINIDVGYGEENGYTLGSGALGQSQSYLTSVGYSQLVSALSADATSATDASAVASLPSSSPVNGTYWTTTAQAKALGLMSATGSGIDGYVGFSNSYRFTYTDANGVASGTYDFNGTVLHEISEIMGRDLLTGRTIGNTANSYSLYDLFHYSAPGVRDFSASTPGYFSVDGGTTDLAAFNTSSGGDAGDWASSVTHDAADAFATAGVVNAFSATDLTAMDAIGWNLGSGTATSPAPLPASQPTGVSISPMTGSSAAAQLQNGLAAGSALATAVQVGGTTGDSYTYALGGTGAAAFTLASANNVATLSAAGAGVGGSTNGKLYALAVTATDTTAGTSSPAVPLDVVVGSSGNDNVQLATLAGAAGAAIPTFIYALAGTDTINGSGMTGQLWFVSGAGADTMTGGSGVNDYVYGATNESTSLAMDVITNFHAAVDLIDLTGLGTALSYAGQVGTHGKTANKLAAHSIGWQTSGGNTDVYVNTSSSSESLGGTNMKMQLDGSISLGSANFLHH